MAKQLQFRRLLALTLLLAAAFAGLGYRLVDLQVVRHGELSKEARNNTQYSCPLTPRRGDILDINGNLLATSAFVKTVCVDPTLLGTQQAQVAQVLAPLLQTNIVALEKLLAPRWQQNKKGELFSVQYVRLKTKVSTETWDKITNAMEHLTFGVDEKHLSKKEQNFYNNLRRKAIFTDPVDDQLRNYPSGSLASHVIGFVGLTDQTNGGNRVQVTVGLDGIEKKFDSKLRGVGGWRVSERDRQKREMVSMREEDLQPRDGLNVVLTIDSRVQQILEEGLADGMKRYSPISVSGVVIRPRTGEILALASLPTFDPNNPGAAPEGGLNNRVIVDVAEPGSAFKIVPVSGALNEHVVKLTDQFNCEFSHFLFAGKVLHDDERAGFGMLSVSEIIEHSSNIGAAKIGILFGQDRLYEYVRRFGFGRPTGIALPAESWGIVHDLTNWTKISVSRIPMGQGISVTSLQMAMAMSAVANHGILMQPMIVDRLTDQSGRVAVKYLPQTVRRVISEEADKDMVEALKTVVSAGTATSAGLSNYTVAGKTGTAQKVEHGVYINKHFSSFVGFLPADNPEICVYIALDAPNVAGDHGGQTAGPIFKDVAEKAAVYLNIRPDKGNPTGLPETPGNGVQAVIKTALARTQ